MEKIAILKDVILNTEYTLVKINSKELTNNLINSLNAKHIDYKKFNKDLFNSLKEETVMNTPIEIYEYQNFFLLEKDNGEYLLLDGFRRLLWNETINHDILVRVYKEKDMTEHSILKLLVSLNHTKFFVGIGNFYDRGFALAMYTIFGVDITKIYNSFNGYLTIEKPKYEYHINRLSKEKAHVSTLDKVSNPSFIADMRFLQSISESDIIKMDDVFGSFISNIRQIAPEIVFDATDFITKIKANAVLMKQIESFKKANDSRGNDIGNKMFEMFTNILLNKVGEKSFIERKVEIKNIVSEMKKEKDWFNYTNNKKYFFTMISNLRDNDDKFYRTKGVEGAIKSYFEKNGEYPKVKVVVYPSETPILKEGVYDDFEIIGFKTYKHTISTWNVIQVKRGDVIIVKSFNKDNKYDLSKINFMNPSYKEINHYNDIVLYIKDLNFDLEK
jgi:hypothetical protein